MQIGVPKESKAGETLVAATPKTVAALIKLGHEVAIERGAGELAAFPDALYAEAGAELVDSAWDRDVVIKVNAPTDAEIGRLRRGAWIAAMMAPARSPELVDALTAAGVTALAMDAVPRISRAQALDVLSSMANLGGYRAVIEAAHEYGGLFTGQVTAAGKVPPATVFVVGAGVAGLAAIGAANSLGAIVRAFDVRPEVAEQVESMGGQFVHLDVQQAEQRSDGYAAEMSGAFEAAARAMYEQEASNADIVITTALIPGRPAPELITAQTVAEMKPGSVMVDLAASNGGNIAGTQAERKVVTDNGVTIIGYTDLPSRLPTQASQLYGTNMVNLMKLVTPQKDGVLVLDLDDVVQRGMTVTHDGAVLWPPPPVTVTVAPSAPPSAPAEKKPPPDPRRRWYTLGLLAVIFAIGITFAPGAFLDHLTVFALAVVIGYYVISNVTHALHTPLMSVTNAISGIILVGALLQIGSANIAVTILSFFGILIASINIFGGFAVTQRMLKMFRKG